MFAGVLLLVGSVSTAAGDPPALPAIELAHLPEAARERVEAALQRARSEPRSARAAGDLAMLLHAYERRSEASAAYGLARALDPTAFEWAYLDGLQELLAGDAEGAVPLLASAVALRPASVAARLRLGDALAASGDHEGALRTFRGLAADQPDLPQAHYGRGRAAAALGQHDEAARSLSEAVRLFPGYGAAHYAQGLLLRDLRRPDEARRHLALFERHWRDAPPLDDPHHRAVQRRRRSADAVLADGIRLGEAGDVEGAIRAHEEALALDPGLLRAHANLIAYHAQAERWEKVEEHYRAAEALAPDRPEVHYNLGQALRQQGRPREAAVAFRRVLGASPRHAQAHHALGALAEAEGRLDEAEAHYAEAAAAQAGYHAARFDLGRIFVRRGRPQEAVEQFLQIVETADDQKPRYLYALGAAYARIPDPERARRTLEEALRQAEERGQGALAGAIRRDLGRLGPR